MITVTPMITKVINEPRREIVISLLFVDDAMGDTRTLSGTGPSKTDTEGKTLLNGIIRRYHAEIAHEALIAPIIVGKEAEAKAYVEAELNG